MPECPHCHSSNVIKISTLKSEPAKPDIPNWFVSFISSIITTFIIIFIIDIICPPLFAFIAAEPFLAVIIAIFVNSSNSSENKAKRKAYKEAYKLWKNGYECYSCGNEFVKSGFLGF